MDIPGGDRNASLRTSDPLARKIFEELRVRSIAERRFVLRALVAAGRSNPVSSSREGLIESCLERYRAETGLVPSFAKYEAWRREVADSSILSASTITRTYGSWNRALGALGMIELPDPTSQRLLARRRQFTDDEVKDALRRCAKDLDTDAFTLPQYRDWAIRTLRETTDVELHIPISKSLILRRFGSFKAARLAAGLDPESTYRSVGRYSDEELIAHLSQARREIQGRLSSTTYARWRREKMARAREEGALVELPCVHTYDQRFGGWLRALSAVEDVPTRRHEHVGPPVYSADWIAERLIEAWGEIGEPFFVSGYQRWARERRSSEPEFPPPDYHTIRRRISSWERVRELVRRAQHSGDASELIEALRLGKDG
jgi:hypothetical protein